MSWQTFRLKHHYWIIDERAGLDQPPLMAVSIHHGVVPRDSLTDKLPRAEDLSNYKICQPNDIIVNRMRAFQGAIGIAPSRGLVSPDYMVLRAKASVDSRYLHYLFRSSWFVGEMISRLRGIGGIENGSVRTPRINPEDLGGINIPLPGLEEQRRIADFLDVEVNQIDLLLSKRKRLASLLEERIDARVLEHVGSSSLGRVSGARTLPIRRLMSKVNRPPREIDDVITAFRDGQVTARSVRRADGYTLAENATPQGQYVELNDVVVHGLDGFAGAIGTAEMVGNCSPVYHVCVPRAGGDPHFLGRLLRVLALQEYLGNFAVSTRERAVDLRNWKLFGDIPIPVVSENDQKEIGDEVRALRPFKVTVGKSSVLAGERRQALITAAVTGQLDVTTARPMYDRDL